MTASIFEQVADALDASMDGRGFGADHEALRLRVNALPVLEHALRAIEGIPANGNSESETMSEAITATEIIIHIASEARLGLVPSDVAIARIDQAIADASFSQEVADA